MSILRNVTNLCILYSEIIRCTYPQNLNKISIFKPIIRLNWLSNPPDSVGPRVGTEDTPLLGWDSGVIIIWSL
jgi:hypothetical protein